MRSDVSQIICGAIETLLFERTRDQFGRAWTQPSGFTIAAHLTADIEREIDELIQRTTPAELKLQEMHAKLQKAWWESTKHAAKAKSETEGFRLFVRRMNAAFERKLF